MARRGGRRVGEDNNRRFQPFGAVHGHHPHLVARNLHVALDLRIGAAQPGDKTLQRRRLLALDYERRETPSLQGFIAWLRSANAEVKRDMEIARDEVRVMTVHGAKGLEAPVVVLADTTTPPAGHYPPRLLTLTAAGAPPDAAGHLVWSPRKDDDVGVIAAAR